MNSEEKMRPKYEPLLTEEAVNKAFADGRRVEFTVCGCDYQAVIGADVSGWVLPFADRALPDGVAEAFRLGEGRRYRAPVLPEPPEC